MSEPRALLQTDVVDSTGITERLGEAAASSLWQAHDRMARDLLREWRGQEIDKSDGFLLLFAEAADAAHYALAYHRELARLDPPLQARIGLHTGLLQSRSNSPQDVERGAKPVEVDGIAKPIVARTMALAQPQQTLVTAAGAATLSATDAPWRIASHGHWRLQGLAEPIELFELGDDFGPPPDTHKAYRVVLRDGLWLPRRELPHSVPAERDVFVNRKAELADLAQRFRAGARLVCVHGTGGIGKTRFAKRFAWSWLGDYPGGVWFCDLSQARTLDGVVHAVAQGLELAPTREEPIAQIGKALASRGGCLIVLDNFEQVVGHAEQTVGAWLESAPLARFIVTTRESLGIVGEQTLALSPLPAQDASTLFDARASAVRSDYAANADERGAIASLVSMLDGLPLAIELAAARVRVMQPTVVLDRMSERFKVLVAGSGRHPRQATLRAAFDWSWDLLSASERSALAQLSTFEGGFSLEAAEAVLDLPDGRWAVDVLQSLVDKSLVRHAEGGRFGLLRSVQEYAADRLATLWSDTSARAEAEARHWRFFASCGELVVSPQGLFDVDNRVIACERASSAGDAKFAAAALASAWAVLKLTGPFRAAVDLAAKVRSVPDLEADARATVEWVSASASDSLGDVERARAGFAAALDFARAAGDRRREACVLCAVGEQHYKGGRSAAARATLLDALASAEQIGDLALQCWALNGLGTLAGRLGDTSEATVRFNGALALAKQVGDLRWEGGLHGNLGTLAHDAGRLEEARRHYEQALSLVHHTNDRRWEGNTRCNLGLLHHEQGRSGEAQLEFQMVLTMARAMGLQRLEAVVLCNLGIVAEARDDPDEAAAMYEQAVTVAQQTADPRAEGQFRGYLGLCRAKQARFDAARGHLEKGETLLAMVADRAPLALLLCQRAMVDRLCGDTLAGRAALARAQAIGGEGEPGSEYARCFGQARALLDAA